MSVPAHILSARSSVTQTFDSTCTISRDAEGAHDDWWDPATGQMVPGTSDSSAVYEGACLVRSEPLSRNPQPEAGAAMWEQVYRVRVPVSTTDVLRGDTVVITACPSDDNVVGRQMTVSRVEGGTYAVSRVLSCIVKERGYEQ